MQGYRRPHLTLNGDVANPSLASAQSAARIRRPHPSPMPTPPGTPDAIVEVFFTNEADEAPGPSSPMSYYNFPSSSASAMSPSIARTMSLSPRPAYFNQSSELKGVPPPPYSAFANPSKGGRSGTSLPLQKDSAGLGLRWRTPGQHDPDSKRRRPPTRTWFDNSYLVRMVAVVLLLACAYIFLASTGKGADIREIIKPSSLAKAPVFAPIINVASGKYRSSFRDQLQPGVKHLISPNDGELALQVIDFMHVAHLADLTARSVIVTPFDVPAGAAVGSSTLAFSSIFDLQRFKKATKVDVIDYDEVRPHDADPTEYLGCWVSPPTLDHLESRNKSMSENGFVASYFPIHSMGHVLNSAGEGDSLKRIHEFLGSFINDASAQSGLAEQAIFSHQVKTVGASKHSAPDSQVMCVDHSLYRPDHPSTTTTSDEIAEKDHTAYFSHGRYLYFSPELQETAMDIASFVLGHRGPYIAVHISAAAQRAQCELHQRPEACELVLSKYVNAVEQVRNVAMIGFKSGKNREHRHNIKSLSVLVSTDVADLGFRGELASLGWTLLEYDDLELVQRFGAWSPDVMDGVIHSSAKAFVGTKGSPKSILGALRTQTWRQGPTQFVS